MSDPAFVLRLRLGPGHLTVWPVTFQLKPGYVSWCRGVELRLDRENAVYATGFDGVYTDGDGATRPLIDRFRIKRVRTSDGDRAKATDGLRFAWMIDADALAFAGTSEGTDVPLPLGLVDFADTCVQGSFYFEPPSTNVSVVGLHLSRLLPTHHVVAYFSDNGFRLVEQSLDLAVPTETPLSVHPVEPSVAPNEAAPSAKDRAKSFVRVVRNLNGIL